MKNNKNKKNLSKILYIILTSLIIIGFFVILGSFLLKPKEVNFAGKSENKPSSFMQSLKDGEITQIMIKGSKVYFNTKDVKPSFLFNKYRYSANAGDPTIAYKAYQEYVNSKPLNVDTNKIILKFASETNFRKIFSSLVTFIILVFWIFIIYYTFKGAGMGAAGLGAFNKSKAKLTNNINTRFSDVAGAEEEKEELKEIVEFLKNPQKYKDIGAKIPKGVLLVGPPGTGKTLFAKAIAGEAGVPFYTTSGSEFQETFVGTGAARVRDLFEQAKNNAPCIIFIDEIDALGKTRDSGYASNDETLNQLLVQMDGFETEDKTVIILAATNRSDVLDPALLRSGRFSRQIFVDLPDVKGREEIFAVHSRNKPLAKNISYKILSRMTSGFSGADIENILNEAAMRAVRENRTEIIMVDILESINRLIAGPKKVSRVVTQTDKRITAYHECGHAIIAKLLDGCDDVQEISIVPRGMAAGYTITRPNHDNSHVSKSKLNDTICMMLGGRAAEKLIINDFTTGASNDIERATEVATRMVTEWGMSDKVGIVNISRNNSHIFNSGSSPKQASEKVSQLVDSEIRDILEKNFQKAIKLLEERRTLIDNMVLVLFECNTIYTNEVNMLFDGKSPEEVIAYIKEKTLELGTDIPRNIEDVLKD